MRYINYISTFFSLAQKLHTAHREKVISGLDVYLFFGNITKGHRYKKNSLKRELRVTLTISHFIVET
jgi:hypothetical protein